MSDRTIELDPCPHFDESIADAQAQTCQGGCGSDTNLRVCARCGYVGCCESQDAHNREHWKLTGHPVIRSYPIGPRSFTYCWECRRYLSA